MGGALTGAAFNPARALGPMIATGNLNDAWLYVAAPIVGAIIAAIVHTGLVRLAQPAVIRPRPPPSEPCSQLIAQDTARVLNASRIFQSYIENR